MQAGQDITIGGRLSRTQYQYTLTDNSPTLKKNSNKWAPQLRARKCDARSESAAGRHVGSAGRGGQHIMRSPSIGTRRVALLLLGLTANTIDQTLPTMRSASGRSRRFLPTRHNIRWCWRSRPSSGNDASTLAKIYVPTPSGAQVPLSTFAHFVSKVEPLSQSHQGQFPAITLSFNLAPGAALGQAVDQINAAVADLRVPPTVNLSFQGTAQAFQASLSSMPLLVAAAILVVYIVLGILHESYGSIRSQSCPRCPRPASARW